jgi:hypothetical protein
MRNLWTYRQPAWIDGRDLAGYDVDASDGGIGKIDRSTAEADSAHVVVDTGWWIFGKKRLIPAGAITAVDHVNRKVSVGLTKDQIKDADQGRPRLRRHGLIRSDEPIRLRRLLRPLRLVVPAWRHAGCRIAHCAV